MSSFASAAQGLNLKEGDALFGSAQQIWTMLDEMASSSPEKYAAFIAKQKKEHEELVRQNKPPTPKFAVSTKDVCLRCVCLYMCLCARVSVCILNSHADADKQRGVPEHKRVREAQGARI